MHVESLDLDGFRNYEHAQLAPSTTGVTLLQGENGAGKTNLLEAVAYLASLRSFRGSGKDALVKAGHEHAVLRLRADREGRAVLVEAQISPSGRDKLRLNRQPVRRHEDLLGSVLVTIFSPDDIEIVKGGPALRRQYLDELLVALHAKHAATQAELERVLKQRNALLRSANGALRGAMASTLDVWDAKLAQVGEPLATARENLVSSLGPAVDQSYRLLAGAPKTAEAPGELLHMAYERSWQGPLIDALGAARAEDVRRGATSVGPQRDDLQLSLGGLLARGQASQGEQRSTALALRLAGHHLVTERQGTSPVLLLDDVFSELDPVRSAALASCLPEGQTLLSAAGPVPPALPVRSCTRVVDGSLLPGSGPMLSAGP